MQRDFNMKNGLRTVLFVESKKSYYLRFSKIYFNHLQCDCVLNIMVVVLIYYSLPAVHQGPTMGLQPAHKKTLF